MSYKYKQQMYEAYLVQQEIDKHLAQARALESDLAVLARDIIDHVGEEICHSLSDTFLIEKRKNVLLFCELEPPHKITFNEVYYTDPDDI